MTMVERVARAMRPDFDELYRDKAHYRADNHGQGAERKSDFGINGPFQADILEDASAAIQAMMEPTLDMVKAAQREEVGQPPPLQAPTTRIWRAMLQAALDEEL